MANSALFTLLYLGAVVVLHGGVEPLRQFVQLMPDLLPGISSRRKSRSIEDAGQIASSPNVKSAVQEITFENKY